MAMQRGKVMITMENDRDKVKQLLSDEELTRFSTPLLNRLIKHHQYNEELKVLIKRRRRTIKNHGYAAAFRAHIQERIENSKEKTNDIKSEISQLQQMNVQLKQEIRDIHENSLLLKTFAEVNNIRLPEECEVFISEILREFS
ncbi:transcription factor MafG-like [Centruroides vittatus]|uniref:transcription factor MafG-like n=1 Tax=Centruroides vittatus TaxID=120091 RepID=UPI00350EB250